jgi:hypothetical protein
MAYPFFKAVFSDSFEVPKQIDIFSDFDIEPLLLLMEFLYLGKIGLPKDLKVHFQVMAMFNMIC